MVTNRPNIVLYPCLDARLLLITILFLGVDLCSDCKVFHVVKGLAMADLYY